MTTTLERPVTALATEAVPSPKPSRRRWSRRWVTSWAGVAVLLEIGRAHV